MKREINTYLADSTRQSSARYLDPLVFWADKKDVYPNLFLLALKVLPVPATSLLSEQIFSTSGQIGTKGRINLAVPTME